jgi:hypothetical protein
VEIGVSGARVVRGRFLLVKYPKLLCSLFRNYLSLDKKLHSLPKLGDRASAAIAPEPYRLITRVNPAQVSRMVFYYAWRGKECIAS